MSIREIEEEIIEIEKVKERFKPGTLGWNNIEAIIKDKRRLLSRLKTQEEGEEDDIPAGCGGDHGSCSGGM